MSDLINFYKRMKSLSNPLIINNSNLIFVKQCLDTCINTINYKTSLCNLIVKELDKSVFKYEFGKMVSSVSQTKHSNAFNKLYISTKVIDGEEYFITSSNYINSIIRININPMMCSDDDRIIVYGNPSDYKSYLGEVDANKVEFSPDGYPNVDKKTLMSTELNDNQDLSEYFEEDDYIYFSIVIYYNRIQRKKKMNLIKKIVSDTDCELVESSFRADLLCSIPDKYCDNGTINENIDYTKSEEYNQYIGALNVDMLKHGVTTEHKREIVNYLGEIYNSYMNNNNVDNVSIFSHFATTKEMFECILSHQWTNLIYLYPLFSGSSFIHAYKFDSNNRYQIDVVPDKSAIDTILKENKYGYVIKVHDFSFSINNQKLRNVVISLYIYGIQ